MPAHGGQAALTDLEMTRAVGYMVSGGKAADAKKVAKTAKSRTGEQVVKERCQECHSSGKQGAPKARPYMLTHFIIFNYSCSSCPCTVSMQCLCMVRKS